MKITGILHKVFETEQVNERFKKRMFVVMYSPEMSTKYPISFQLSQMNCDIIDGINPGDDVVVRFNLTGREWTDRNGKVIFFNTLVATSIYLNTGEERVDEKEVDSDKEEEDDLPF